MAGHNKRRGAASTRRHEHNRTRWRRGLAPLVAGLAVAALAGCGSNDDRSHPQTESAIDTAPIAGAPNWCDVIDDPAVTGLFGTLPRLLAADGAAVEAELHAAASVLRVAVDSADEETARLLNAAADSLDTAAGQKTPESLQVVATALDELSRGVQNACGFQ